MGKLFWSKLSSDLSYVECSSIVIFCYEIQRKSLYREGKEKAGKGRVLLKVMLV